MTIATLQDFNADTEMCSNTGVCTYSNLVVIVVFSSTTISTCKIAKAVSFYNELEIHTTAMFYLHRGRSSKVRNDVAANYDENVNITCVYVA